MKKPLFALLAIAIAAPVCALAAEAAAPAPAAPPSSSQSAIRNPQSAMVSSPSPVLAYVPGDADLAIFVRVDQLKRSALWKKITAPGVGLIPKFPEGTPLAIDIEQDVAAAVLVFKIVRKEGWPEGVRSGWIFEMNRDVRGPDRFAYPLASGQFLTAPSPRIVVLADADSLAEIVRFPENAGSAPPALLAVEALRGPGEMTLAARVSPELKDALLAEYARTQKSLLRPGMGGEEFLQFALVYNLMRIVLEAESVTGSLDLSREAEALRADVRFRSAPMAPFMVATLQALADPLQMALPALAGGLPLDEVPPEPFYRAVADGRTVHITLSRAALERLVDRLTAAARAAAGRTASAENLRIIGEAVQIYVRGAGEYPRTWSDLVKTNLLRKPALLENPALITHLPTGDYELVPLTPAAAERKPWLRILAYEVYPKDERPPHINVLFADGKVECLDEATFNTLYKQTLESLGP